ncbi:uncharacterized protein LOC5502323 [Nematostella vectensis]|uniref:uncharacterized protein LOC5502323 n=1 Tax=Nematostella vectensis TaxID=45351 RepID=UPI0020771883|nr:uncharacterized protein LOC5502323 [Nematostella vectensis]
MLDVPLVNLGLADHTYCLPPSAITLEVFAKLQAKAMENGELLRWEDASIAFEPPNSDQESKSSCSSLSPAHSVDSGFDAGMESLLADFLGGEGSSPDLNLDLLLNEPTTFTEPKAPTAILTKPKPSPFNEPLTEEELKDIEEKNKKNAIAARENRAKKKKYVEDLEKTVQDLKEENQQLQTGHSKLQKTVEALNDEVSYYKNVLANQSTLSLLLNRIATTPGINFGTSFGKDAGGCSQGEKRREVVEVSTNQQSSSAAMVTVEDEGISHRYHTRRARKRPAETGTSSNIAVKHRPKATSGGICLHVSQDKVSLEMCQHCSAKALGIVE